MQEHPGIFIVLEGSDGSGKTTQFNLLSERLRAVGHNVEVFDFPRYDQASSHFIKRYLNGDYGPASQVNPYTASMFYALDRYEASADIRKALQAGKVVLSNRYAGSNMAHQGSKFSDETEQRGFFVWADSLEFSLLNIPRPDINLFLRVPAEISFKLIGEKSQRSYTKDSHDQHEANIEHLRKSVATYDLLCQLFPKDFVAIECSDNGQILSVPDINNQIWERLQPLLPASPPNKSRSVTIKLDKPKTAPEPKPKATATTSTHLEFKLPKLSQLALSSLEAAPGIMITAEQLWLSNKSEFAYYAPPGMAGPLAKNYTQSFDKLIKLQQQMRKTLIKYLEGRKGAVNKTDSVYSILRPAIPLAALSSATLSGEIEAFNPLVSKLNSSNLAELRDIAKQLRNSLQSQGIVVEDKKTKATTSFLEQVELNGNLSADLEPLKLMDYWPRSEFSLLADGIYPYTDLGREEISQGIERWTFERKEKALRAMALDPGNPILEQAQYRWDVISDRQTLRRSGDRGLAVEFHTQAATPRYGYDIPAIIEEAGLEDSFTECFDISLGLFSQLQSAENTADAGYAVLLGHKLRWQFSINAQTLVRQISAGGGKHGFTASLIEKITAVHPTIASAFEQAASNQKGGAPAKPRRPRRRSRKSRH